ncbi:MAG: glutamine--fructose-6-phosphate transaminase (isomerizing) [Planctomycetes bacterium]|nr:glutamine--fructose-6-phosphate transaminase (isomerizing) [Planctomycetota bacterium]
MCGIVGYIGNKPAEPILIEGLKRLEYRGYDSVGIAVIRDGKIYLQKCPGRISNLEQQLRDNPPAAPAANNNPIQESTKSTIGIAHTRWATHGKANKVNAHPHTDCSGKIAIVHNGIIENYASLKQVLIEKGHQFTSQTDSEILAHLIEEFYQGGKVDFVQAVQSALREVSGTYGLAVICADQPDILVAARKGSPLIVGVGADEYIVASDAAAIVAHTANVVYLNDNEVAVAGKDGLKTLTLDNALISKQVEQIECSLEEIALGGYEHFMLKEIFEQPECLRNTLRGRLNLQDETIQLGGLTEVSKELIKIRRIILTGCGTAWHAGLIGEYLFEDIAKIPAEVEYASELRYRNPIIEDATAVIAVSQSGETADTLSALREVKQKGALTLGVVNVVGSSIARETDAGVYLHVGPEIGVASTKAFTAQITVLALISLYLGRRRFLSQATLQYYMEQLSAIPDKVEEVLQQSDKIAQIARECYQHNNWLFLGRGYNYPIALEGALKLKEISYIHAEGLPAAEMKHGPIALIHEGMPVVFLATRCSTYEKILGNIQEVRARGGRIIAIATRGDGSITKYADDVLFIPDCPVPLTPILTVVPLQLLAYHAAVARGCDVDKPRNLAKSVTVE